MKTTNQSRIFISYSHRGNGPEWKAWLLRHLGVFERHHLLDVWQDGKIRVSSYFDDDITQAMTSARLAVVLLTPEALKSTYILEKEFPFLRERQQRDKLPVFPVICEPCNWKVHDWLRATQAPNESNPISPLAEAKQNHIFRQLATDIATELSRIALVELPMSAQPPAPDHIYLEKFPLTRGPGLREEKLIGREQELALLDLAFTQSHTAIVSLVAWGGVGKTMLVQHWLRRLQREGWFGTKRVYAWSFYSQGTKEDRQASEDTFLAHALEWFGVQCETTLSPWDKGRLLADAVARERTLLILDGIEPLQYPPGPMGGQLRAPGVQSLLKHLARKANAEVRGQKSKASNSLCLVTTREPLTDLADFQRREGSPWGSVLRVDLGNLTDEAGAALLHHAGANRAGAAEIKPDDKELLAASREVDGHALTLNLLGRFIARAHGGDIRRRDLVKFEEADRKEQGGTTFKMLAAFENWFAKSGAFGSRQLAVLQILGLFDRPADAGCIGSLRKPPVIAGLTDSLFLTPRRFFNLWRRRTPLSDEDWKETVSFLCDFGLVKEQAWNSIPIGGYNKDESKLVWAYSELGIRFRQPKPLLSQDPSAMRHTTLESHPLIREYFARHLKEKAAGAWKTAHWRLYTHLCESVPYWPEGLCGLAPLYQAVVHGCQASRFETTCNEVYLDRIMRGSTQYSTLKLGAYASDLEGLACFFREPWERLATSMSKRATTSILAITSFDLRCQGRLVEAQEPIRICLALAEAHRDWKVAAKLANNLGELLLTQGEVTPAIECASRALRFADEDGDLWLRVSRRTLLGEALLQAGKREESLSVYKDAIPIQEARQPERPLLHGRLGFRYWQLTLWEQALVAYRCALEATPDGSATRLCTHNFITFCKMLEDQVRETLPWLKGRPGSITSADLALTHLTVAESSLYRALMCSSEAARSQTLPAAHHELETAIEGLYLSGETIYLPQALADRAWVRFWNRDLGGARTDLDEAWDIAERGPMRLHMADIRLHRARLFFRAKSYPWKSPQDDLAAAEKLINECGYHRRDEELADAKHAILGS
ncbi:MAG: TIR domain-containing protein [Acidobacteria bacterium]|nr:MAG: TIR domain-containing protein [Acidobacteriota bacterium]